MKEMTKIALALAIAGATALGSTSARAWWGDNDDYWDHGPWYGGYPGYGWGGYPGYGWGGYPGYGWGGSPGYGWGGWGGYPGYGWGGYPRVQVITTPEPAEPAQGYRVE